MLLFDKFKWNLANLGKVLSISIACIVNIDNLLYFATTECLSHIYFIVSDSAFAPLVPIWFSEKLTEILFNEGCFCIALKK